MKPILQFAALLLAAGLAGCGGTSSDTPLPIDDNAPHAYTLAYLNAHPEALVQPEHLIVVPIDPNAAGGGTVSVRLWVREPMTVSLGIGSGPSSLAKIAIHDESGAEQISHRPGEDIATAPLRPGASRIVFVPVAAADDGQVHTIYLKLADTPSQAGQHLLLGATAGRALGVSSTDSCQQCSFDGSNLSHEDFSGQDLTGSSFASTNILGTWFVGTICDACTFTNMNLMTSGSHRTSFERASLKNATIQVKADGGQMSGVSFAGATLDGATLNGRFNTCDFGPSTTGQATSLRAANLQSARIQMWGSLNHGMQRADLTGALVAPGILGHDAAYASDEAVQFTGAKLNNLVPSDAFKGYYFPGSDFSGTSFAGMDLSQQDLSVANGVIMSAQTDISQAILSNGVTGVNLAGQNFGDKYTGFAGTIADAGSGKDLRFVNLSGANLHAADLTRANLGGANLIGTNLSYSNLYAAVLIGAQLGVAPGDGTQAPASLDNAYMPLADFSDADLRSVSLAGAHAYGQGTQFNRARLDSASFISAYLMQASFVQASMNDTDMSDASLVAAIFDGATLTNAKFTGAALQGADFGTAASVQGVNLNNSAVSTTVGEWNFTEADGTPLVFQYGASGLGLIGTSSTASVICPSGASGPCSGAKLLPIAGGPPYPPTPPCIPRGPRYDNCPVAPSQ